MELFRLLLHIHIRWLIPSIGWNENKNYFQFCAFRFVFASAAAVTIQQRFNVIWIDFSQTLRTTYLLFQSFADSCNHCAKVCEWEAKLKLKWKKVVLLWSPFLRLRPIAEWKHADTVFKTQNMRILYCDNWNWNCLNEAAYMHYALCTSVPCYLLSGP